MYGRQSAASRALNAYSLQPYFRQRTFSVFQTRKPSKKDYYIYIYIVQFAEYKESQLKHIVVSLYALRKQTKSCKSPVFRDLVLLTFHKTNKTHIMLPSRKWSFYSCSISVCSHIRYVILYEEARPLVCIVIDYLPQVTQCIILYNIVWAKPAKQHQFGTRCLSKKMKRFLYTKSHGRPSHVWGRVRATPEPVPRFGTHQ